MSKNWIVCTGLGAIYRGAFGTLEEAFQFVVARIVRPRGHKNFEWTCQMTPEGVVDYYRWCAVPRSEESCDFPGGFVPSVSVSSVHRERQHLARSDAAGNDNSARWAQFAQLIQE
jgi:hypothetical protein